MSLLVFIPVLSIRLSLYSPAYVRIDVLQAGINGNPAGEIAETRVGAF